MSKLKEKAIIQSGDSRNSKKLLLLQFALVSILAIFLLDKQFILQEVRQLCRVLDLGDWDTILSHILLPGKTLYEISKLFGLFYIFKTFFALASAIGLSLLLILLFVKSDDVVSSKTPRAKQSLRASVGRHTYLRLLRLMC